MLLQTPANNVDITISELARDMSLSQATVTTILDRLERRELVSRVRSETDRRKVYPRLTEHGREILASAPMALQDNFVRKFGRLEEWEQSMVISSLQRIAGEMDG